MRQTYLDTFNDIENITQHKDIYNLAPQSAQQNFLQTIGAIVMCTNKQAVGDMLNLLNVYKGSFSNQILGLKYCTYCMEKDKSKNYQYFTILKLLAKWVETLQNAKKKKDVRLYQIVIQNLELGISTYEQFIVYLNYISFDLTSLIKSGSQQTKKKYPDLSQHPHLDSHDLIKFLNTVLPKILTNIIIPRNFFPPTLLKSNQENVDLLYSNQNLQNITQNKIHYNTLLRTILKTLFSMQLQPSQIKQLILCSFKYYYIYHHDKNCCASQYVIQSLKKMTSAVRYAISDEIALFLVVLKKLGKQLFISYLSQKFSWISEITSNNTIIGINKSTIKPYYNQNILNSLKLNIAAGKSQDHYIEIYDRFSLVYFCINCIQLDITVRFYYLGKFNQQQAQSDKKLLFFYDKRQGIFQGSVQAIEQGIYMFQFDNTYSWMKGKTLNIDITVLVPIQLRQQSKNKVKQVIYEKYENMNEIPFQNIVGWVDQNQIKVNSTSANISYSEQANVKTFNLKLIKNTGQAYQYETDLKSRFLKKLKVLQSDPNLFWLIDGYKVKGINQIQRWLNGQFQPDKLQTIQQFKQKSKMKRQQNFQKQVEVQNKQQNSNQKQMKQQEKAEQVNQAQVIKQAKVSQPQDVKKQKENVEDKQQQKETKQQSQAQRQQKKKQDKNIQEDTEQNLQEQTGEDLK